METEIANHARTLAEDGVVVIEDYLDEGTCEELYEQLAEDISAENIDRVTGTDHGYTYRDFVEWGGPVAVERAGRDEGMIDVFNVDGIVPEVDSFRQDNGINEIINESASANYSPDNVNVYWNRSVTTTRDFHADTYANKFKSFVYLTDVPEKSFGPFSYITGSHRTSKVKTVVSKIYNKLKGNPATDAVFYDEDNVNYYTADKGTLIIANQSGYHRGYPQEEGQERMLMTTSYTPA
jgi:hypothetical protein